MGREKRKGKEQQRGARRLTWFGGLRGGGFNHAVWLEVKARFRSGENVRLRGLVRKLQGKEERGRQ